MMVMGSLLQKILMLSLVVIIDVLNMQTFLNEHYLVIRF